MAVIGNSFAHGIGVGDDHTLAALLSSEYHYKTRNLAIGSYATMRELEVLRTYGAGAKYVVLQYCSNHVGENEASLRLTKDAFTRWVETWWKRFIVAYNRGKAMGYRKSLQDLDDHINARGHRKLAAAIATVIAQWESAGSIIEHR